MGPTLSGIEDLLKMSYGCGEQNMIGFVPNVFVSTYLTATNRLSEDIKTKVETFLEAGMYVKEPLFVCCDITIFRKL
jgi:CD109 antigen